MIEENLEVMEPLSPVSDIPPAEAVEQPFPSAEESLPDPEAADPVLEKEPVEQPSVSEEDPGETAVEVISVDELVDRLTGETEGTEIQESVEEPVEFAEPSIPSALEIAGMDELLGRLEMIQVTVDHPAMDTPFEEYTVAEGLLLLLLVLVLVSWCVKIIKGGFSWLLW